MAVLLRRRGGGGNVGLGTNNEGSAWVQAVAANGGVVTASRALVVERFIAAEKAAGTWDLTDDYWALWAENAPQALTSLKQRRLAVVVPTMTFTPDRGYQSDGTTGYINSGFIESTHAVAMTGTNKRVAVYERAALTAGATAMGASQGITQSLYLIPRNASTSAQASLSSATISKVVPGPTSLGWTAVSRNDTVFEFWRNGVSFGTVVPGSTGSLLMTIASFIGALNNVGTPLQWRASPLGFTCVGAQLTATQELAQYNNVQAWATAVGANV